MTLRKYKKLLMSYGVDRDLAEQERKVIAVHRAKLGIYDLRMDPERTASVLIERYHGSMKQRKHIRAVTLRRIRETAVFV